ncbi:hypothetical protein [Ferruginivarius sediminum]|uniref:Uncharacterized protein n=1 Tax=Ferruginivarius sediminum TaxID=2661937 RepID=A0A369TAK8_9PROT|nr:hypothetical protein [Ferruginivarius sediminum]RDD62320.1 hypothetical protein DRB17_08820 [Ferruginivarius sediminum]
MPIEQRSIIFSPRELKEALQEYAGRTKRELPASGVPNDVAVDGDPDVSTTLKWGEQQARFDAMETTAAVLMYAQKKQIPIPRRARKSLSVRNGSLALMTYMAD